MDFKSRLASVPIVTKVRLLGFFIFCGVDNNYDKFEQLKSFRERVNILIYLVSQAIRK